MYKIKVNKKAIESITNIVKYISLDNVFYANKVQEYIYNSIKLLEDFPFLGVEKINGYRIIIESKYKFKIVYRVNGTQKSGLGNSGDGFESGLKVCRVVENMWSI